MFVLYWLWLRNILQIKVTLGILSTVLILICAIVFVGKSLQHQSENFRRNLSDFDENYKYLNDFKSNLLLPNIALDFPRKSQLGIEKKSKLNMNITKSTGLISKLAENLHFRLPKDIIPSQVRIYNIFNNAILCIVLIF